jgi:hypothetical protein
MISPGKVFRNEATDATHEAQFHQVELLYVAKDASLAMMIGVIQKMFSEYFGSDLKVRLRSSYFPFVEPGNEVDVECFKCFGTGRKLLSVPWWWLDRDWRSGYGTSKSASGWRNKPKRVQRLCFWLRYRSYDYVKVWYRRYTLSLQR